MQETEKIEEACCRIIASAGTAKSKYIEMIRAARKGDFESAEKLKTEAKTNFVEGHKMHLELFSNQDSLNNIQEQLLLMHAEDQLMSTETISLLAEEMMEAIKENKR